MFSPFIALRKGRKWNTAERNAMDSVFIALVWHILTLFGSGIVQSMFETGWKMVRLSYCSKGSKNCLEGQRKTSLTVTAAPLVTLTEEDWHSWCIRVWRNSVMVKVRYISKTIIGVSNIAAVVCHLCHVNLLTVMTSLKLISRSSLLIPLFIF